MMNGFGVDLRGAALRLRRAPGLAAAVVLVLAPALAACVVVFAVFDAVLLEPLPFRDPERVVHLRHVYKDMVAACSPPTFVDYRRLSRSFESLSATTPWNANLTGAGEPERIPALRVSADFFATLGVTPARGRAFERGEESPGRERVVLVGHDLWQRRFGGDPGLVGRSVRLDGQPHEVIGIMPPGFQWGRRYGREARVELWAPFALTAERVADDNRGSEYLDVYGRLAAGVSPAQAEADVRSVIATLRERHPRRYTEASGFRVLSVPLRDELFGPARAGLTLLLAAVFLLLVVAAANVAGLLLARAVGRRRDSAVRSALGASRGRLAREALAEATLLASVASVVGLVLAHVACSLIETVDRVTLPRAQPVAIDFGVAALAAGATLVVALVAGLLPAWSSRDEAMAWLRTSAPTAGSRETARARRLLLVGQAALAVVLAVGAGLLVRSLDALDGVDPGFRTERLLVARVQLPASRYGEAAAAVAFADALDTRLGGSPRLRASGVVSELPLGGESNSGTFRVIGRAVEPGQPLPHAETWSASPGYFETMGIPVLRGRGFRRTDGAAQTVGASPARVAVVNEALARRYFAGVDPIGRQLDFDGSEEAPLPHTIVGVVGDVRDQRLDREAGPQAYVPYAQRPTRGAFVVVRTAGEPLAAVPELRSALKALDAELPLHGVTTMQDLVAGGTRERRTARTALAAFAGAAMSLSALGLFALVSQLVRERRAEIGLRLSLGARRRDVVALFVREGGGLALRGLLLGAALAVPASHLLRGLVFGVTLTDPVTYSAVGLVVVVVALAACAMPAWRAARVDAWSALRAD
jgi:predicted permease